MSFQAGGTLLEMCVLAALSHEDLYGYALTQLITRHLPVSESTLYPVLRRLKKEECLYTRDEMMDGRNRRYYVLTSKGKARLEQNLTEWREFTGSINALLEEKYE